MTVRIEPKEVLSHLNSMGFYNITVDQLKKFITDLKKLIKYDLQQCGYDGKPSKSSPESYCTDETGASSYDSSSTRKKLQNNSKSDPPNKVCRCTDKSEETDAAHSSVRKDSSTGSSKLKRTGPTKCRKDEKGNLRHRSAFIKPWNLEEPVTRRSDPVALYHKYQSLWQQQRVPGDDCHDQLRWRVREKMLGKDPQPRVRTAVCCSDQLPRMTRDLVARSPGGPDTAEESRRAWTKLIPGSC